MARSSLSASLVLSTKELKHFHRFQRQELHLNACEIGTLPSITEYIDYLTWRAARSTKRKHTEFDPFALAEELSAHLNSPTIEKQNCGFFQPFAEACKHPLHPGALIQAPKCPVCTIHDHVVYLEAIEEELENAGEAQKKSPKSGGYYDEILSAWSAAKLCCLQYLAQVEESAIAEQKWTGQNPDFVPVEETRSAKMAIEEYWDQFEYASDSDLTDTENYECARHVQFAEDTNFSPGRREIYFCVKSPRYEPGRYAMEPSETDEEFEEDNLDVELMLLRVDSLEEESETGSGESSSDGNDTDQTSWDEVDTECKAAVYEDVGFIVFGED